MATFTAIPEKTQSAKAMKRVLDYVMQEKKTLLDGVELVSGQNCVPNPHTRNSWLQSTASVKQQVCSSSSTYSHSSPTAESHLHRSIRSVWRWLKPLTDSR